MFNVNIIRGQSRKGNLCIEWRCYLKISLLKFISYGSLPTRYTKQYESKVPKFLPNKHISALTGTAEHSSWSNITPAFRVHVFLLYFVAHKAVFPNAIFIHCVLRPEKGVTAMQTSCFTSTLHPASQFSSSAKRNNNLGILSERKLRNTKTFQTNRLIYTQYFPGRKLLPV